METEAWISGLVGGLLIGLGAATFLLLNGRIAGVSGILGGVLDAPRASGSREGIGFLVGLIGAPAVLILATAAPALNVVVAFPLVILGGLLAGYGARTANGCTSGHGVCGISRFSPRSIVAMAVSVGVGMLIVTALRHVGLLGGVS